MLSRKEVKELSSLRLKKHRHAQGRYVVEGARLVAEALDSPLEVQQVLVTDLFTRSALWPTIEAGLQARGLQATLLSEIQAQQLADTRHPQGIFAVVSLPLQPPEPERLFRTPILILDDIADPGNLGTLLRTADWFAVPTVWISPESADIYNPKVVRGGMGAHFHIPNLWQGALKVYADQLRVKGITLLGATLDGMPLREVTSPGDAWALVIGSEAQGLSTFWRKRLDEAVTIPGGGQAESLNAAVAGGIILHYLVGGSSPREGRSKETAQQT